MFFKFILSFLFSFNLLNLGSSSSGNDYTLFNKYIEKYNKKYESLNEYVYRYEIFNKKLNRINYVNSNNFTYKLALNKYSDLNFYEFSNYYKGYNGLFYDKKLIIIII